MSSSCGREPSRDIPNSGRPGLEHLDEAVADGRHRALPRDGNDRMDERAVDVAEPRLLLLRLGEMSSELGVQREHGNFGVAWVVRTGRRVGVTWHTTCFWDDCGGGGRGRLVGRLSVR